MTDTDPTDVDAVEARANAATEGPWYYDGLADADEAEWGHAITGGGVQGSMAEHLVAWCGETLNRRAPEDAEFIAAARTDVPALVAEVRRLRAELERVIAAHGEDWQDGYETGCEASHSIGCDAVQAERDQALAELADLRADLERARATIAAVERIVTDGGDGVFDVREWGERGCTYSAGAQRMAAKVRRALAAPVEQAGAGR